MSTQPNLTPQWKQEVNRRLAAHKNRKGQSPAPEDGNAASAGSSRAAQAADRVAARYAKAPSYSQMQAEEARVAVRAAEIATEVALQAQAAAETALAEMHAATQDQPQRGPAVVHTIVAPPAPVPVAERTAPVVDARQVQSAAMKEAAVPTPSPKPEPPAGRRVFGIRWDPDMPVRRAETKPAARRAPEEFELSTEDWWSPAEVSETLRNNPIEVGEADQFHANLIQFPRELVATRKMRPRLAEGQAGAATDSDAQLSIFEVDPATISTEAPAPGTEQGGAASAWHRAEWSGIKLDTQPVDVLASAREVDPALASLPVASVGFRLMAAVVDCALILASFVTMGFFAAHAFSNPPAGRPAEVLGVAALALIGVLYYAFFFAFPISTPGMKYAGIGLCTFDDQSPTRAQLRRRLGAMLLSLLPVGLGLVWSIFDDDHLSWHDRFSRTYLRRL